MPEDEKATKEAEEESKKAEEQSSEEEDSEEEELTPEQLKARNDELAKLLRETRKEAKERRLRNEQLEKEKKEREEAELSEAQKAQKRAEEAEARAKELEEKNRLLTLRTRIQSTTRDLKLSFVNSKAEEDAIRILESEDLGEDLSGLEDALKDMAKDRSYYFGKAVEPENIRDGSSKGRTTKSSQTQEVLNKKRSQIRPL